MADHYIPGKNAHIDTSDFEAELASLVGSDSGWSLDSDELAEAIYLRIDNRLHKYPSEPRPDAIVCRYMTLEKFVWFLTTKTVYFGDVSRFDDSHDCGLPLDYASAVMKFYFDRNCPPLRWDAYVQRRRRQWLISCWTELDSNVDDYLLWYRYAGGPNGVAITADYQQLKEVLLTGLYKQGNEFDKVGNLCGGKVSYDDGLRLLPFNKRKMFKNEKEVRFAGTSTSSSSLSVSVEDLFDNMGLRLSPDASLLHQEAVFDLWHKFGGNDNVHIAGD